MKRLIVLIFVALIPLATVNYSAAITKIALKTKFDNKSKDYQAVKEGVKTMLK